jgi:hypothetical protein
MGSARGVGGIAISSSMMENVPLHFMGRVQNIFYFAGTALQVILGMAVAAVAHRVGLSFAFAIVAMVYAIAFLAASWPVPASPGVTTGQPSVAD